MICISGCSDDNMCRRCVRVYSSRLGRLVWFQHATHGRTWNGLVTKDTFVGFTRILIYPNHTHTSTCTTNVIAYPLFLSAPPPYHRLHPILQPVYSESGRSCDVIECICIPLCYQSNVWLIFGSFSEETKDRWNVKAKLYKNIQRYTPITVDQTPPFQTRNI